MFKPVSNININKEAEGELRTDSFCLESASFLKKADMLSDNRMRLSEMAHAVIYY